MPGLAKTLAAETLADVVGGTFARIQFTPDLLPSDIVGTRIYRGSTERFDVELGPVFVNFLLTDEINRAPAKVQSALLEVMAEQQVSIGGVTHLVPQPFLVVATQNPIESEGVYQLPDAQRDRFMMKILIDYPTADEELAILDRMSVRAPIASQVISLERLKELQDAADSVYVDRSVAHYAIDLVQATRHPDRFGLDDLAPSIGLGVSPRATLFLVRGARAIALLRGRTVRDPPGRVRRRARGPAAPAAVDLRRARPRHHVRPHRAADPRHGAGGDGVTEAGPVRRAGLRRERPPSRPTGRQATCRRSTPPARWSRRGRPARRARRWPSCCARSR